MCNTRLLQQGIAACNHFFSVFKPRLWQYQHKLLATKTRHQVTVADGTLEQLSDPFQAFIALQMAIAVVVLLEIIDIKNGNGQRLSIAYGAVPFLFQHSIQTATVGYAS